MKTSVCKELLNIILNLGQAENICCLCLEYKDIVNDFGQTFEIQDQLQTTCVTLKLIVKKVINFYDKLIQNQACDDCTQLLLKMYILQTRNETKSKIISNIIKNIDDEINEQYADNVKTLRINISMDIKDTMPTNEKPLKQNKELRIKNNIESQKCDATICESCGKDCKTNKSLKSHLNTHKHIQCPHCLKTLKTHSHYSLHVRRHITSSKIERKNKTRHNCTICQYSSWSKLSLNAHINKSHQKVRPFVCDICLKGFYSNSNLIEHKSTHNKQDIICDVCGEIFVSKKGLQLHLRLHTGEKPHSCTYCDLTFVSASRKTEHIKRKHSEPVIQCKFCNKTYRVQKDFNRHLKTHLKNEK